MTDLKCFCQCFILIYRLFKGCLSFQVSALPSLIPASGDFPRHPLWEYHTGRVRVAVTDDRRCRTLVTAEVSLPPSAATLPSRRVLMGTTRQRGHGRHDPALLLLFLSRQRGRSRYKCCGGTLFPNLLSDYKRNGVETIRDAGSHVSFL